MSIVINYDDLDLDVVEYKVVNKKPGEEKLLDGMVPAAEHSEKKMSADPDIKSEKNDEHSSEAETVSAKAVSEESADVSSDIAPDENAGDRYAEPLIGVERFARQNPEEFRSQGPGPANGFLQEKSLFEKMTESVNTEFFQEKPAKEAAEQAPEIEKAAEAGRTEDTEKVEEAKLPDETETGSNRLRAALREATIQHEKEQEENANSVFSRITGGTEGASASEETKEPEPAPLSDEESIANLTEAVRDSIEENELGEGKRFDPKPGESISVVSMSTLGKPTEGLTSLGKVTAVYSFGIQASQKKSTSGKKLPSHNGAGYGFEEQNVSKEAESLHSSLIPSSIGSAYWDAETAAETKKEEEPKPVQEAQPSFELFGEAETAAGDENIKSIIIEIKTGKSKTVKGMFSDTEWEILEKQFPEICGTLNQDDLPTEILPDSERMNETVG